MKKVVIRFKSGFNLPVTCERVMEYHSLGTITDLAFEGCEGNNPLFYRLSDIECVYEVGEESNLPVTCMEDEKDEDHDRDRH